MYYIVNAAFCTFLGVYPMGILWVCYGYLMVKSRKQVVNGR